jgi:hypothetical protein
MARQQISTVDRTSGTNTGLAKVAVLCFADTFVVNQSMVLRINICGENCQLLVAAKRYKPFKRTKPSKNADKFVY